MTTARTTRPSVLHQVRGVGARYGALLARPGAGEFFVLAGLARLGVAMTGLGLLLAIRHASGSYAVAGTATGTFAAAEAVGGPQTARLVDRWGQTRAVPVMAACHAAAVATALVLAAGGWRAPTVGAVALAGASVPQPGALSAARWAHLLRQDARSPQLLRTAFTLEATVNDVVYLTGPLLVTAASTALAWWAGSAAAALLVVGGCAGLAARPRTAPPPTLRAPGAGPGAGRRGVVGAPLLGVLAVNAALGCFFGAVPVLVVAAAAQRGTPGAAGPVLAASSAASLLAGLAYGSAPRAPRPATVLVLAAAALLVAVGEAAAWPTLTGLVVMLVIGGAAVAPLLASSTQLVHTAVQPAVLTQALVWVNTASTAGLAGAAAVTGALVQHAGQRAATTTLFAVLAAVAASGAVLTAGADHRARAVR